RNRIDYVNGLYNKKDRKKGCEFGSHAVGHFHADQEQWDGADWASEFRSYNALLNNIAHNNGLPGDAGFDFSSTALMGFRAPFLEVGRDLSSTLSHNNYWYATSVDGDADSWPVKDANGIWSFNLASIPVAGYDKMTLSMDYNFLALQSGEKDDPDPNNWPRYRQEMFDAYMNYFKKNYEGNRAPVHIGHHFAEYQGGAYKQALMAFAKTVHRIPEVKCVNYSELRDFLESWSAGELDAYQRGDFKNKPLPRLNLKNVFASASPLIAVQVVGRPKAHMLQASLIPADSQRFKSGTFTWSYLDGKSATGPVLDTEQFSHGHPLSVTLVFRDGRGLLRWKNTFSIVVDAGGTTIVPPKACCAGLKLPSLRSR